MDDFTTTRAMRFMPQMVIVTVVIAVVPVVLAWWLRAGGVVNSGWACVAVAVAASLLLSAVGNQLWRRRRNSSDILFSELLLWGWLRRYRVERQLVGATTVLGLLPGSEPPADPQDLEHREHLLMQLGSALDAQDPYLDGHSRRVARYSTTVARRMGLSDTEVKTVRAAAAVHDVGKLRVPAELLRKSAPLTDAEYEAVMRHAEEGAAMVACLGDDEITEIVRHHHERIDGLGYPDGLSGDEIPLGARIVAVADTFDAITSARPYRPAARHKQAIDVLEAHAGTQLDPDVVRAFLRCYAGRNASVMWVILAVSPQRAIAWMRHMGGSSEPAPLVPVGELAATTIGRALVVAAAVGTSVGVGVARNDSQAQHHATVLPLAAAVAAPVNFSGRAAPPPSPKTPRATRPTTSVRAVARGGRRFATDVHTHAAGFAVRNTAPGAVTLVGGAPGAGSAPAATTPGGGLSTTVSPTRPVTTTPVGGRQTPKGGTTPAVTSPAPVTVGAPTPPPTSTPSTTVNAPATAGGTSTPPASTPSPTPSPPAAGGGTTGGGDGPGDPKHGGPGDGGWGRGGRPHGGPGDGGWGPGGNPRHGVLGQVVSTVLPRGRRR